MTVNVLTLAVSVLALVVSALIAMRQVRFMRHANNVPVAVEMLSREFRSVDFQRREAYVLTRLREEHDPVLGFGQLPEPARTDVFQVAYFYQTLAFLVAFELADQDLVLATLNYRIKRIWPVLEPYVRREREIRGQGFLNILEDLVVRAHENPSTNLQARLKLRTMPVTRTSEQPELPSDA